MPFIQLPDTPGIRAGFEYAPALGMAMSALAETLLRGESPLDPGFRELIAALVSKTNETRYCTGSHSAAASEFLTPEFVDKTLSGTPHPDKMKEALLTLAEHVALKTTSLGRMVDTARREGATERMIHDTVAIAAAFCMFNRYVDGLGMSEAADYKPVGERLARDGYIKLPTPNKENTDG